VTAILVKAPNWVGDCIMATPALAYLRGAFPDARIDVLARPSVAGVLRDNPDVTDVIAADDRKMSPEVLGRLRAIGYDAIALMPNSLGSAWLAFKLRIPRRVGFARGGRRFLLTHALPFDALEWQTRTPKPLSNKSIPGPHEPSNGVRPHHMVEYYLRIAKQTAAALRNSAAPEPQPHLQLMVSDAAREKVADVLQSMGLAGKRLISVNPGAAYGGAKRWPAERMAAVAQELAGDEYEIVSTASRFEIELTDAVQSYTGRQVHRVGEQLTLQELAALLPWLSLLITNDSGVMHMAAALEVPTIAIFGPTDWNVTYPFQQNATVIRHSPECAPCFLRECPIDHRCMTRISVDQVIAAGKELLAAGEPPHRTDA
jgi:heptosyltransferase-2